MKWLENASTLNAVITAKKISILVVILIISLSEECWILQDFSIKV